MEKGSSGAGVNLLLAYLLGWGSHTNTELFRKLECDGKLGEVGMECIAFYQKYHGLAVEGGFGPQMREKAKSAHGFDFEQAIASTSGTTIFVQLSSEPIAYYHGVRLAA